jgi:simple sugar transport system permease protein
MGGRGGLVGTLVGVLIFGLLSDILQLHNINSNLQLVLKGLIIVCTVLVQERNLGQVLAAFGFTRTKGEATGGTTGRAEQRTAFQQEGNGGNP